MKASAAIAIFSMGAAQVSAAPVLDARQDDFIWSNPDEPGNTQVSIGDGCKPNEDLTATALLVNSNIGTEQDIRIQVEGSFNAAGDRGSKAQLLDLAKKAMEKLYDDGIAEREQGVIYQEKTCPGFNPMCNNPAYYTDQWKSTNHVSVRVDNDDDGGMAGFLNIGWSPPEEAEIGICGAFTAAGVGLGLANAFAGAGLVLAGVACAEI